MAHPPAPQPASAPDAGRSAPSPVQARELAARNRRLGLILASVALMFFVGFVVRLVVVRH